MNKIAMLLFSVGIITGASVVSAQSVESPAASVMYKSEFVHPWAAVDRILAEKQDDRAKGSKLVFKHGNVDWLPALAVQAGWPADTIDTLTHIVLRESGGCPNRRGGDMVDKNCVITGVSEWNHRSDTGLLQINGVNYDRTRNKWAAVCREMNICTQEPLLDPLTNLKAGLVLWRLAGFEPWNPCNWDKSKCSKNKP